METAIVIIIVSLASCYLLYAVLKFIKPKAQSRQQGCAHCSACKTSPKPAEGKCHEQHH